MSIISLYLYHEWLLKLPSHLHFLLKLSAEKKSWLENSQYKVHTDKSEDPGTVRSIIEKGTLVHYPNIG